MCFWTLVYIVMTIENKWFLIDLEMTHKKQFICIYMLLNCVLCIFALLHFSLTCKCVACITL